MDQRQIIGGKLLVNYYETSGTEDSPVLVFLHGWRADGKVWTPIVDQFREYQSFCLDLPGFGKSQKPDNPYTVGDYAKVLKTWVAKLKLEKVVLVGHSFGGRVAIKIAAENPPWLAKLVLVDSAGIRQESVAGKLINVASKVLKPITPEPVKKTLYKFIGSDDYITTPELKDTFIKVISEDLRPDLEKINVPALIIWGKDDKETPVAYGEIMHSLIPNSRFLILSGAGHYSFIDKPNEFVAELRNFLSS